jgi:hypothetical protein
VRIPTVLIAATFSLTAASNAAAQPIARADVAGTVGWFNADKAEISSYNDWYNRSAYGGATFGWYWNDHLKTELEVGATSSAELYATREIDIQGQRAYVSSDHEFSTRRLVAGQQYQFFRNAWVHPHVAAGVDLTWETHEQHDEPIVLFDSASRVTRVFQPAQTIGPSTRLHVRPFAEVGAKLYVSSRSFFRTDLRLTLGSGAEEVLLRVGFGVDF